jgi:two-component system chemotaxis response regulator CheB
MTLAQGLTPDFPAAVLIVLHLPASARSLLPHILSRSGPLPAAHPLDGETLEAGRIYVAPPNRHLILREGHAHLGDGPRENRVRPAADVLFRSAAQTYGRRAIGVVLSGADGDGTLGLEAIRLRGGVTIAQDPSEATFPSMPKSAIARATVDHVLTVAEIPPLLVELITQQSGREVGLAMSPDNHQTPDPADEALPIAPEKQNGLASGLTCPDCQGAIWELAEGQLVSFECRVGHRYNPDAFLGAQSTRVEDALWTAVNVLQERAATLRQFASRYVHLRQVAEDYEARAVETDEQAAIIRGLLASLVRSDESESGQPI